MKIVSIEWLDSSSKDGIIWQFKDELEAEPVTCYTVGYLISKNRKSTIVAQSYNDDQYGRVFTIPTKSIVDFKYITI